MSEKQLPFSQSTHINRLAKLIAKRLGKDVVDVQAGVGVELIISEYLLQNDVRFVKENNETVAPVDPGSA